jgi:hypothetical protein
MLISDADGVEVAPLALRQAVAAGALLAATGSSDVIDASVCTPGARALDCDVRSGRSPRLDRDLPLIQI